LSATRRKKEEGGNKKKLTFERVSAWNIDPSLRPLEKTIRKADGELFENLRLFVERIMLYRITRTKEKAAELAKFAVFLLEAAKIGDASLRTFDSSDLSSVKDLAKEKLSASEIAGLFSALADALENLNAKQLYYFLGKLRSS
jgi:hypothetical protein